MNETLEKRKSLLNDCLTAVVNDLAIHEGMTWDHKTKIACVLFQELCKDERQAEIYRKRFQSHHDSSNEPATEKQKDYLKFLGVEFPENITKSRASELIEQNIKKKEVPQ